MSTPEEKKDLQPVTPEADLPSEDAPVEETSVEEASAEETPAEEAPAEEAPAEEAPEEASQETVNEDAAPVKDGADVPEGEINLGQEQGLELISYVIVNLVDHPEDVTFDLVKRQGRDVYLVRVHPEDLGKVIGKGGQTARALRVLLMAFSARTDQRIGLEIVE